jgi:urease accessory protein
MNADTRGLLALLWIASPALPVGAFSYSEGLEAGVDDRQVHDEASAGDWLIDQLHLCLARSDLPVAARSRRAALRHARTAGAAVDRIPRAAGWCIFLL